MDCLRFTELASAAEILPEETAAYEEHRAQCSDCASAEATLTALRESVALPSGGTLAGFAARVRTRATREQMARVFSPTRSALSAAAVALSAAAVLVISLRSLPPVAGSKAIHDPKPVAVEAAPAPDDDVDLLSTSDDPFASLTDDELREVEQMMNDPSDLDEESGT
jgi:hypothetical protein